MGNGLARLFLTALMAILVVAELGAAASVPAAIEPDIIEPAIGHQETPDDAEVVPRDRDMTTSPRADITFGRFRSIQVNVDALGNNIIGDAANEPSIAVNPLDSSQIAIGWRQFTTVTSNFRQAGWGYTQDGGETWTFPGVLQPGVFRSDPVLDYDADGTFYYNSLRSDFSCQYYISGNGGATWSAPYESFGGDKQWSAIDRTGGVGRGNIYLAWSPVAGCCAGRLFTRSTNGALSFMEPIELPGSPMWGTLAVAPNGNLFITGRAAGSVAPVLRSTNAQNPLVTPTFTQIAFANLGGDTRFSTGPNPGGLLGQVWIACEPEGGPRPNNVYLLASVDRPGGDPLDVMFTRSTNGGLSWSAPLRINDDSTGNAAWQWFATMSVAPDGRIDAVWADTRLSPAHTHSQLYFSMSRDGGLTWTPNEALTPQFNHSLGYPNQNKLGDYYHMYSDNGYAYLAYAATFNGEQDVYFLRIPIDCNENGTPDDDDIAAGTSLDCDSNGIPDECDVDCDGSGGVDACEIAAGLVADCNGNHRPDDCDLAFNPAMDCDDSGLLDSCEVAAGTSPDCNANGIPDMCDITSGAAADCNANAVPDSCDALALALTITPPQPAFACVTANAGFAVSAPGATAYQWRFQGQDLPNENGPTLTIPDVVLADEGSYSCRVSFGCISVISAAAPLHVIPQEVSVQLVSAPQLQVCTQGNAMAAAMFVSVNDTDGAIYQWSLDGTDLEDSNRVSGAQSSLLNVTNLQPGDSGTYTCRVWNPCIDEVNAASTSAVLDVIDPEFNQPPANVCAETGEVAVFTAQVEATLPFVVRWYEGETLLNDGGRLSGTSTNTLQLANVQPADLGRQFRLRAVVIDPVCSTYSPEAMLLAQPPGGCAECPVPGDLDADGDYDLVDMQQFALCFGADVTVAAQCACANVAAFDSVVDSADWVLLEQVLSGPFVP